MLNTEDRLLSFFDIEKTQLVIDKNINKRWLEFENFIYELKEGYRKRENNEIKQFWEKYIKTNYKTINDDLFWINRADFEIIKNNEDLKKLLKNIDPNKKALVVDDFSKFNSIDNELPNFDKVTSFYRGSFLLNKTRSIKNYQSPKPILLLGNPGIGKTYYAKKLASILNTTSKFIDANSITANWVLSGHNKGWQNGSCGLIFKEVSQCPTISPIMLIDEIDKLSFGKNYDPNSTFHQMFEKTNSISFYDEFAEVSFDASRIIYILTANNSRDINSSLLSRMNVFEIKNPTPEEMIYIIQKIYKSLLSGSKLFKNNLAKKEVDKLVFKTPREAEYILENNLFIQASQLINQKKKTNYELTISDFNVKEGKMGF